jgi:hypothetical protein
MLLLAATAKFKQQCILFVVGHEPWLSLNSALTEMSCKRPALRLFIIKYIFFDFFSSLALKLPQRAMASECLLLQTASKMLSISSTRHKS